MPSSTLFVVQPFARDEEGVLIAGEPKQMQSADQARRQAHKIAPDHAGVIAFQRNGDASLGDYEPAMIIVSIGEVPDDLE